MHAGNMFHFFCPDDSQSKRAHSRGQCCPVSGANEELIKGHRQKVAWKAWNPGLVKMSAPAPVEGTFRRLLLEATMVRMRSSLAV